MTKQEEKILEIINNNPLIEQSEIAKLLKIQRSTVAVHISNLQKQGLILGKGYIVNKNNYVVGIGAANIDIYGKSKIKIRTHYDHPADINSSIGGVARNILTNLARLDVNTKFITMVGNDDNGNIIIHDCKRNNIDTSNITKVNNYATGTFLQIQDENNDMYLAVCDMSVLDTITPKYIRSKRNILLNSKLVLIDSSLRTDTIEEIINICKDNVPIYVDPISDNYALKIKNYAGSFTCIKPNKTELENLSGMQIKNDKDLYSACQKLLDKGLEKIFVSRGKDGILYMDNQGIIIEKKLKPIEKMVNASGAGDACMAAILYGIVNELKIEKTIDYALAAGISAVTSKTTINENMSVSLLNRILKENRI